MIVDHYNVEMRRMLRVCLATGAERYDIQDMYNYTARLKVIIMRHIHKEYGDAIGEYSFE